MSFYHLVMTQNNDSTRDAIGVDEAKATRLTREYGPAGVYMKGKAPFYVRKHYKRSRKMETARDVEVDTEAAADRVLSTFEKLAK